MTKAEKRAFPRVESSNFSYVYLDKKNQVVDRGTGKTINISEGGFLIETNLELKKNYSLIATIELPDDVVELQGKIVHCKFLGGDKYIAGVQIDDISNSGKPLWKRLIDRLLNRQTME
jgi:hypothetical protein